MTEPMTEPATSATYSIEKLLTQSVQPFDDLPPDEFEVLKQSIKNRGLIAPILLTTDGYLFDGHQRLKALLALGRKRINSTDIRIAEKVNRDNMHGYALATNMVRRMQTTEQKVARMRECEKLGWSQRRIAKEFALSQPAVSQLFKKYPAEDDDLPTVIHGEDGRDYVRRKPRKDSSGDHRIPEPRPWEPSGKNSKAVRDLRKHIAMDLPTGLDEWQKAKLAEDLEGLIDAAQAFLDGMESM